MFHIENDFLQVSVKAFGAELTRIYNKQYNLDYLWNGNAKYWGKQAPVLFPIVGTLKNNTYFFKGKPYHLSRHGFARDCEFKLIEHKNLSVSFELRSDEETLKKYPFEFTFRIRYLLQDNNLINEYEVINDSKDIMYFSVGGHPAFHLPLENHLRYTDYYLEFDKSETAARWILEGNLFSNHSQPFLESERRISLSPELFVNDAIVLKNLQSESVSLKSNRSAHGLTMSIQHFPYLGIWAAPDAPFVCIEPWYGIADSISATQNLEEKEGVIALAPQEQWKKFWEVTCF